jgi:vacuolar-type H+-ATPase subunit I/STV1
MKFEPIPSGMTRSSVRHYIQQTRAEVKRTRQTVRAALAALVAKRRELQIRFKQENTAARARLREQIAKLRAQAKQKKAERRAAFIEALREIDAKMKAARAELAELTPAARQHIRALMLTGASLRDAKRAAAGAKGAAKQREKIEEIRDEIVHEEGIDHYRGGASKQARQYILSWLRRRAPRSADALQRLGYYDPARKASAWEQWSEWKEQNPEEWHRLKIEWSEAEIDPEIERADRAYENLAKAIKHGEKSLVRAAGCLFTDDFDPTDYERLKEAIEQAPRATNPDLAAAAILLAEDKLSACLSRKTQQQTKRGQRRAVVKATKARKPRKGNTR